MTTCLKMMEPTGIPVGADGPIGGTPMGGLIAYGLEYCKQHLWHKKDIERLEYHCLSAALVSGTGPEKRSSGTSNMQKHKEDTVCSPGLPVPVTGPRPINSSVSSTRPVLPDPTGNCMNNKRLPDPTGKELPDPTGNCMYNKKRKKGNGCSPSLAVTETGPGPGGRSKSRRRPMPLPRASASKPVLATSPETERETAGDSLATGLDWGPRSAEKLAQ